MTPLRPQAVLFDLDGTLVDSYRAIHASVNDVRGKHGLAPLEFAFVKSCVGRGLRKLVERTVPVGDLDDNCRIFAEHHPTVLAEGSDVLPGVFDALSGLASAGVRLGVCSNKPLALTEELLGVVGLRNFFEVVYGPENCARPKPAPDMLFAALDELQIPPAACVYVGDMTIDVETARAAGVKIWAIASGSHTAAELRAAHPDRLLVRFDDLSELVPALAVR